MEPGICCCSVAEATERTLPPRQRNRSDSPLSMMPRTVGAEMSLGRPRSGWRPEEAEAALYLYPKTEEREAFFLLLSFLLSLLGNFLLRSRRRRGTCDLTLLSPLGSSNERRRLGPSHFLRALSSPFLLFRRSSRERAVCLPSFLLLSFKNGARKGEEREKEKGEGGPREWVGGTQQSC